MSDIFAEDGNIRVYRDGRAYRLVRKLLDGLGPEDDPEYDTIEQSIGRVDHVQADLTLEESESVFRLVDEWDRADQEAALHAEWNRGYIQDRIGGCR